MLQNFCFRFKLMENCDFLVDECVPFAVALEFKRSSFVSLAMLGDDEIFFMLHAAFFAVVLAFGNFEWVVLVVLKFDMPTLDVDVATDAIDDFV